MDVELGNWQLRLARHFTELQRRKNIHAPNRPVFALEHGLESSEMQVLAGILRIYVARSAPSREHPLPWIVYAAEIGYRYSGDEYWQTFEHDTPGWAVNGDRYWIRDCYRRFQREFGGAEPSGSWAQHFSIICWPIAHAILPRDLQRQLARILYELRHSFSSEMFESPTTLGEFIAARSWNATSRFQNLAQETKLVGQIAAALLLQGECNTESLIHPSTLQRIGADLDRERRSREWLRSARRFALERARIRGLNLGRGTTLPTTRHPEEARAEAVALGIEPRLILRPKDSNGNSWEVSLEIPDLSHLLFRFPKTRDILTGSRCAVAGSSGRPLARGRCLHGSQRITLGRWPRDDEVLLQFEQKDPQLEYLLRTECLLRPGSTWLFRIASDGLAYESRTLRVRPGERYIMVSTNGPVKSSDHIRRIDIGCEGVHGATLNLPPALTADWEETLRHLGLGQAKAIEVWPAGLAAVVWDGEGRGEWLSSEQPCLAIRTDHPIAALIVSMEDSSEPPLEITSVKPGEPIFVELPQLPVGLHTVRVSTRCNLEDVANPLGELDVVMRIRESRPWSAGVSPHSPLIVQMDPATPTLEQLWEGRAELTLQGPVGRDIKCMVSLFEKDMDTILFAKQLPSIALPVTSAGWRGHFEKHFRETREAQAVYDTARICELEFKAEELGAFIIRCERDFAPLRWTIRRDGKSLLVRLLNDSGNSSQPVVEHMAFETPSVEAALESATEYMVPVTGGLYVARLGEFKAAIIAPPTEKMKDFADLRLVVHIAGEDRSTESVVRAIVLSQLWGQARLSGGLLSAIRQRDVMHAISRHIFRIICGDKWAQVEAAIANGVNGLTNLREAVSRRREETEVGVMLNSQYSVLATASLEERIHIIAGIATRYLGLGGTPSNMPNPEWLSELALRLASDPSDVEDWAGGYFRAGLTILEQRPTLARAARFLVLAIDHHLQSRTSPRELYAGWHWV